MAGEAQGHRYGPAWNQNRMDAFLVSTAIVALAEIGDKTQLLAFILAAKFRRPWPIVAGILIATLLNHAFAAALGTWLTSLMAPQTLRWVLALSFIAMAVWTLIPDKLDEDDAKLPRFGVFGATLIAFFFAEMGDKTQIATLALAAQYQALVVVEAAVEDLVAVVVLAVAAVVLAGEEHQAHGNKDRYNTNYYPA